MNKKLVEKLKNNLARFSYNTPEEQETFNEVGIKNCEDLECIGKWRETVASHFHPDGIYHIKDSYQSPEEDKMELAKAEEAEKKIRPEYEYCEIWTDSISGYRHFKRKDAFDSYTVYYACGLAGHAGFRFANGDVLLYPVRYKNLDSGKYYIATDKDRLESGKQITEHATHVVFEKEIK